MNALASLAWVSVMTYQSYCYHSTILHRTRNSYQEIRNWWFLALVTYLSSLFLPDTMTWLMLWIPACHGLILYWQKETWRDRGVFLLSLLLCSLVYGEVMNLWENELLIWCLVFLLAWLIQICYLYRCDRVCDQIYVYPLFVLSLCYGGMLMYGICKEWHEVGLYGMIVLGILLLLYRMFYSLERRIWDELQAQRQCQTRLENEDRYRSIQAENEIILRSLHDLKKQMRLLEEVDHHALHEVRDDILARSELLLQVQKSGEPVIDTVLQYYQPRFLKASIQWHITCEEIDYQGFDPVDLSAILCNLLDNAFESCSKEPDAFLLLRFHQKENQIIWKMKNSASHGIPQTREIGHGFGLRNMQKLARKYHGDAYFEWEEAHGLFVSVVYFVLDH